MPSHTPRQVRDNIHSQDVAEFIARFIAAPRTAAVYNIAGGKANSSSILDGLRSGCPDRTGVPMNWGYEDRACEGHRICYHFESRRIMDDYPGWKPRVSLGETISQIVAAIKRSRASSDS